MMVSAIRRDQRTCSPLLSLCHVRMQQDSILLKTRNRALPRSRIGQHLDLGLAQPTELRKMNFYCLSHLVYSSPSYDKYNSNIIHVEA